MLSTILFEWKPLKVHTPPTPHSPVDPNVVVRISLTSGEEQWAVGSLPQICQVPGGVTVQVRGHLGFQGSALMMFPYGFHGQGCFGVWTTTFFSSLSSTVYCSEQIMPCREGGQPAGSLSQSVSPCACSPLNDMVEAVPAGVRLSHVTFSLESGHQKLRVTEQAGFRGWSVCPGVTGEVGVTALGGVGETSLAAKTNGNLQWRSLPFHSLTVFRREGGGKGEWGRERETERGTRERWTSWGHIN